MGTKGMYLDTDTDNEQLKFVRFDCPQDIGENKPSQESTNSGETPEQYGYVADWQLMDS